MSGQRRKINTRLAGRKWATDDDDEDGGRRGRRTECSSTVRAVNRQRCSASKLNLLRSEAAGGEKGR